MTYPWAEPGTAAVVGDLYAPITDALEAATDAYVEACNRTAEAENAYLHRFAVAYHEHPEVAVTARAKFCDSLPVVVDAKCQFTLAQAQERACKAKADEVKTRLMAALSWQKLTNAGGM